MVSSRCMKKKKIAETTHPKMRTPSHGLIYHVRAHNEDDEFDD